MAEPSLLKKIQGQPESTRKIIFWFLVIVLGVLFFGLWIFLAKQRMAKLDQNKLNLDIKLPQLEDRLKNLPSFNTPKIDENQLKELENLFKEQPVQQNK